jgi:DNA-binding NarL/FixJ family response regulator
MTEGPAQQESVRVLLADDQRLVRESLGTLLGLLPGIELVASASDGEEALVLTDEHNPDVVLMDLRMPRLDGIEATRHLHEHRPDVRVIALTTYADDESVLGALRAGARGYLTKDASSEDIRRAILTVAAGEAALDPSVQKLRMNAGSPRDDSTSPARNQPTPRLPPARAPARTPTEAAAQAQGRAQADQASARRSGDWRAQDRAERGTR